MPFTNLWDQTFPLDSQLANLLGADCRQLRVDTQQRMAAISGLDAAKPAFGADAQPASWNGILFFATDTGKIYQFNNPAWTDVTASFTKGNTIYKNSTVVNHTGTTTLDTIYTAPIPILTTTSILRISFAWQVNVQGAGSTSMIGSIAGAAFAVTINSYSNTSATFTCKTTIEILNVASVSVQNIWIQNAAPSSASQILPASFNSAAGNTGVASNFLLRMQNSANSDQQTFKGILVELL